MWKGSFFGFVLWLGFLICSGWLCSEFAIGISLYAVCCQEESCWYLGLQRLWKGQGWWCLHFEVRILLRICFLNFDYLLVIVAKVVVLFVLVFWTVLPVLSLLGAPSEGWGSRPRVRKEQVFNQFCCFVLKILYVVKIIVIFDLDLWTEILKVGQVYE